LITLIFGEKYQLWSSSLYDILRSPFTSFLLVKTFFSAPCSQTPFIPLGREINFHTHMKQVLDKNLSSGGVKCLSWTAGRGATLNHVLWMKAERN
jgi:hypothetical protein